MPERIDLKYGLRSTIKPLIPDGFTGKNRKRWERKTMLYRKLPHGDEQISVIGLGTSVVGEASENKVEEINRRKK